MRSEHRSTKHNEFISRGCPPKASTSLQSGWRNAGIIDIYRRWSFAIAFKIEYPHNHPSFIEPFQGAVTGVGGTLRDIFTMGVQLRSARSDPVRPLITLKTGDRNRRYSKGGFWESRITATALGFRRSAASAFAKSYDGNRSTYLCSAGVFRHDEIFYGSATGVVPRSFTSEPKRIGRYPRSVHGSAEFTEESKQNGPTCAGRILHGEVAARSLP